MLTRYEPYGSALLLLLVCTLSFGIFVPALGFYWDDYASLYVYEQQGSAVFTEWSAGQGRPLAGFLLGLIWETFGVNPLPWHGINFVLFVAGVLLFWRALRLLWSDHPTLTTLIALLFAVYPSYHLRPIPISFQISLSLVVVLLSFWVGLLAIRHKSTLLSLVAGILVVLPPLLYEQNLPFEVLRPLVLFYLIYQLTPLPWREWRHYLPDLGKYWLPQVAGGLFFLLYRGVLYQPNETYASYNRPTAFTSLDSLLLTFKYTLATPLKMLVTDWAYMPWRIFVQQNIDLDLPSLLGCVFLLAGLVYLWCYPMQRSPAKPLLVGSVCVVMIMLLVVLIYAVDNVLGDGFASRWALSPSLFAALGLGMLLAVVIRSRIHAQVALLLLVVLGMVIQVGVNRAYVQDWQLRRELWWQLTWRAPQLAPGTMYTIVFPEDAFAFGRGLNDYELTAHGRLYYAGLVGGEPRLIKGTISNQRARQGIWSEVTSRRNIIFRNWQFDLEKLVVFGYDGGCLKTADPTTPFQAMTTQDFVNLAPLHHPEQILPSNDYLGAQDIVLPEPPHTWCFYYQQIQWAIGAGELETAVSLADEARGKNLAPLGGHEVEWVPLIEAYTLAGRDTEAQILLDKVRFGDIAAQQHLCARLPQHC